MRQGALFVIGGMRALLGLYQTFVLLGILCNLTNGGYVASGVIWFAVTCIAQLALLGLAAIFAGPDLLGD